MPAIRIPKENWGKVWRALLDIGEIHRIPPEKGDLAEAELEGDQIVITPKKLIEDKALKELKVVLAGVHQKNKGVSEDYMAR